MTNEKTYLKHGIYIISYLLLVGIEAYFIRSVKVLYSPYIFLGTMMGLGLILNFIFLFIFGKNEKAFMAFGVYQLIQGALAFLIAFFMFQIPWQASLAYPSGALLALLAFCLIRSELALQNILITILIAAAFTVSLRLSAVSGGLLFALAVMNGFYLGSKLLNSQDAQQSLWENLVLFSTSLALGRAAIQYYLIESGYDSLGVVITQPYTFVALFAGFLLPLAYGHLIKNRQASAWAMLLVLGVIFPWLFGIFIHVRPFSGYLLGFVVSTFIAGLLFSGPLTLNLLAYLNYGSGILGLTLFKILSNLSRGIRLSILAGIFVLTVLVYVIQSLIKKNKA